MLENEEVIEEYISIIPDTEKSLIEEAIKDNDFKKQLIAAICNLASLMTTATMHEYASNEKIFLIEKTIDDFFEMSHNMNPLIIKMYPYYLENEEILDGLAYQLELEWNLDRADFDLGITKLRHKIYTTFDL